MRIQRSVDIEWSAPGGERVTFTARPLTILDVLRLAEQSGLGPATRSPLQMAEQTVEVAVAAVTAWTGIEDECTLDNRRLLFAQSRAAAEAVVSALMRPWVEEGERKNVSPGGSAPDSPGPASAAASEWTATVSPAAATTTTG